MDNCPRTRVTYNSALKDRAIWRIIEPVLAASSNIVEQPCASRSSDFTFQRQLNAQCLQVLLVTQSSLQQSEKHNTGIRIRRFASEPESTPDSKKAIAFLLSEEPFNSASGKYNLNGVLALQVLMFEILTAPLPLILINDASSMFQSIDDYMMNFEDMPVASPTLGDSVALLAYTTSHYPRIMDKQTRNMLSNLFPSFKKMSAAIRTQEGQRLLLSYLGQDRAEKIVGFWQEDMLQE